VMADRWRIHCHDRMVSFVSHRVFRVFGEALAVAFPTKNPLPSVASSSVPKPKGDSTSDFPLVSGKQPDSLVRRHFFVSLKLLLGLDEATRWSRSSSSVMQGAYPLSILYSPSIHPLFLSSSSFHPLSTLYPSSIHHVFIMYSSCIHPVFILYSSSGHPLVILSSILYPSSIHPLFILYSSSVILSVHLLLILSLSVFLYASWCTGSSHILKSTMSSYCPRKLAPTAQCFPLSLPCIL
jgi:hypothetical protein